MQYNLWNIWLSVKFSSHYQTSFEAVNMNAKIKIQVKLLQQFHMLQENQYILDLEELLVFPSATLSISLSVSVSFLDLSSRTM